MNNAKKFDPNEGIINVPYERPLVEAIDKLVEMAKYNTSPNKRVESESDWKVVAAIWEMFKVCYPAFYQTFMDDMKKIRNRQESVGGTRTSITKEGEARMQAQVELPPKFHAMFKAIYINQPLTRDFVRQLFKRMPQFRVPEKL